MQVQQFLNKRFRKGIIRERRKSVHTGRTNVGTEDNIRKPRITPTSGITFKAFISTAEELLSQ
jgi:hypothetical protein